MTDFCDIREGQDLPGFSFTMDLTAMVKYAAATWDFHRYHYDTPFVQGAGMPAPFVDGQMFGALLSRMVMSWAGPEGFLRRLSYRQDATVYVDETVTAGGRVRGTHLAGGVALADVDLFISKADGTPVVRHAVAQVQLGPDASGNWRRPAPAEGAAA